MKLYRLTLFLLLCATGMAGCKKYDIAPLIKDPAYIRVFNNLTSTINALNNQQATPFLTFLMDPKTDAAGLPSDAAIVGDYLGTRQLFSLSYPINEANSSTGNGTLGTFGSPGHINLTPVNYEYPGNAHVLAAPVINGLDLSAWAQIPSGKHRVMFVIRPQNSINFKNLASNIRGSILLDTTVNFEKGEVYTLEVVSRDLDNNKYGLYIRKEQFIHQAFDDKKLYVGFVNLSGVTPQIAKYGFGSFIGDKISVTCTYNIFDDAAFTKQGDIFYDPYPGYNNNLLTTLATRMDTEIDYQPLPLLPESAFFYQGLLRTYYSPVVSNNSLGTLPFFSFGLGGVDNGFNVASCNDPAIFNSYKLGGTPNLNLIVNTGNTFHVYPTLNIMEVVYDHVYLMQIQRGFDNVPQN